MRRFLLWGAATLWLLAAFQGLEQSSTMLLSAARLSIDMPYLTHWFTPKTVVVTPASSVFGHEHAMSTAALMARWEPLIQQASRKFNVSAQ